MYLLYNIINTMEFYIGPMSKNVVDSVINFAEKNNKTITLIPSRRQIEYNGGYVNNWTTKDFVEYVRSKTSKILIERDHGGPGQGLNDDDGYESFSHDVKYLDIIHIDPWKKYAKFEDGFKWTSDIIQYCYNLNPNIEYEIGTEEGIRKFEVNELETLVVKLKETLPSNIYNKIKFLVIQCGTKLNEKNNIGSFNKELLKEMIDLANKYNLIAKEHNGDWVTDDTIFDKKQCGLKCINIAPEFGEIETQIILEHIKNNEEYFNKFFTVCLNSNKWVKWVSNDFNPHLNKEKLILICGHYVLSEPEIIKIKYTIPNVDNIIQETIYNKLEKLYKI